MFLWPRRQPRDDRLLGEIQQPVEGKSWLTSVLIALFLIIFAAQAFTSALQKSNTWDESGHLLSGYAHLKEGMDWLEPSHPPFGRVLTTLPLLFLPRLPYWPDRTIRPIPVLALLCQKNASEKPMTEIALNG